LKNTARLLCMLVLFCCCLGAVRICFSEGKGEIQKEPNRLRRVSFVSHHDLIVGTCSTGSYGSIRFWSASDGNLVRVMDLGKGEWADSLAISNNGDHMSVTLLGSEKIGCYSLIERRWLWKAKWPEKGIVGNSMRFTPDDLRIIVVGFRNVVTYDARTGAILRRLEDREAFSGGFPEYRTRNNAISLTSKYAAFWQGFLDHDEGFWSSENVWVVVRETETGKIVAKQGTIQNKYKNCSAVFVPDDKALVLGSMDGIIRVWSIQEQKVIREWRAYRSDRPISFKESPSPNNIDAIVFSRNGRIMATKGHDQPNKGDGVRIWDYQSNMLLHEFPNVISSTQGMCEGYPMALSADGKFFALEQQGKLYLYDTQTWEQRWVVHSYIELPSAGEK
jgi:WD40 repeat protein